jgi:hypothetical protein
MNRKIPTSLALVSLAAALFALAVPGGAAVAMQSPGAGRSQPLSQTSVQSGRQRQTGSKLASNNAGSRIKPWNDADLGG